MKRFESLSPFRSASPNTTQSDSDESVSSGGRRSRENTQTEDKVNINTASRAELVRYVEALSKQSGTYERRFKDMVRAYKHLQTERDTLETSLKASLAQRYLPQPSDSGEEGGASDEVSVLTQAVATLTEEKGRLESQYQEDKKQSLQEQKSQRRTLTDNLEQAERDLGDLLRERQGLKEEVSRLKSENSQLSLESGQLRERTTELERSLSDRDESRYLQQILSLQRQVEEWSEVGRASELKGEETERVLREQRGALGEQELKLSRLEIELRQANKRRDETAADLEARVAELSDIVGRYQQQVLAQEREISQLRHETPAVSPQTSGTPNNLDALIELREEGAALHSTLQTVLRQVLGGDRIGVEEACAMNTSELLTLLGRERGEANPLVRPQTDSDKLCEEYRRRLEETEGLLRVREEQLMGQLSREREEGERRALQFERETEKSGMENKSRVGQVESQLIKLREHTVSLLTDKDSEICRLKNKHGILLPRDQQPVDSAVSQFMSISGYYSDSNSLHLSHTKLRERDKLRSALARSEELESAVRDFESRELKHLEQLSFLQNEINRLDNNLARQGTNLEYLKNVVLQFVTGTGGKKRELFVPLSTVLKLSADESRLLTKFINPKW